MPAASVPLALRLHGVADSSGHAEGAGTTDKNSAEPSLRLEVVRHVAYAKYCLLSRAVVDDSVPRV